MGYSQSPVALKHPVKTHMGLQIPCHRLQHRSSALQTFIACHCLLAAMPATTVPAYTAIGLGVKDLLTGSPKSGAFVLDNKVSYSGKTSSGLNVAINAITKGDRVEPTLKATYAKGNYSADMTYDASSKVLLNTAIADVLLPGLKVSGSVTLPDINSAKASLDYAFPFLHAKATVTLASKPLVDLQATTGYKDVIVGAEAGFDTSKTALTKYNFAVGYHAPDFQVAVSVLDQLGSVKVGYVHNVNYNTKVGAEVLRALSSGSTTVNLGFARSFASGALGKAKIDNTGLLTTVYETRLASGEKVAASFQVQATDLSKPVKYGFAIDLTP